MRVTDIMVSPVHVVPDTATLEDVARAMLEHGVGGLPVVDADGRVVGMITQSDFSAREHGLPFSTLQAPQLFQRWIGKESVEAIYEEAKSRSVKDFMTRRVGTVDEDATLNDVLDLMLKRDINRVPVVRDGKPVGMISRHDLLRLMLRSPNGDEAGG